MKKKMKSFISILLTLTIMLATAGCGGKDGSQTEEPSSEAKQQEETVAEKESSSLDAASEENPYAEKVSLHFVSRGVNEYTEDNSVNRFLEEKFNVDLTWEVIPSANYQEAISALIASGDYPDVMEGIFGNTAKELPALYEDGIILGLNELLEKYGQDVLAARNDDSYWMIAEDGQKIGIPCRLQDWPGNIFMIRQDWLDALGLDMPTTLEELDEVARAFTFDDPDGNGEDDTIGYAGSSQAFLGSAPFAIGLGAYGETLGWEKTESGQWEPWQIREGTMKAIKWYRNAYMEGIAEPDFASMTSDQYYERMNMNRYGIQYYWTNNVGTSAWWTAFNEAVPQQRCVLLPQVSVEGEDSHHPFVNDPCPGYGNFNLLIFETCEHPDRAMAIINYLATDEGRDLINFGVEGEAWDDVDGKVVMKGLTGDDYLNAGIGNHTLFFWRCVFDRMEDSLRADSIETYPLQWKPKQCFAGYSGDVSTLDAFANGELVKMVIEPDVNVEEAFAAFREQYLSMGGQEYIDYMSENFDKYN